MAVPYRGYKCIRRHNATVRSSDFVRIEIIGSCILNMISYSREIVNMPSLCFGLSIYNKTIVDCRYTSCVDCAVDEEKPHENCNYNKFEHRKKGYVHIDNHSFLCVSIIFSNFLVFHKLYIECDKHKIHKYQDSKEFIFFPSKIE